MPLMRLRADALVVITGLAVESILRARLTGISWMACTSAFCAHAAALPALATGGMKTNTWGLLCYCKLTGEQQNIKPA